MESEFNDPPPQDAARETQPAPGRREVKFSLVIPAYNEAALLPRTLQSVAIALSRYPGNPGDIEVIVADNQSTDITVEIAEAHGCRVVREEKRCIAAVRNAGVRAARASWVGCVDADTVLHPETFRVVLRATERPKMGIGMTGSRLDRNSFGIRVTTACCLVLAILLQMDTGVVFFRKADWEAIGGYNESIFVAEDIDFLRRMGKQVRKYGRRRRRVHGAINRTSSRKFDTHGDWHIFSLAFRLLPKLLFRKEGSNRTISGYWYGDREG